MLGGPSASAIETPAGRGIGAPEAIEAASVEIAAGSTPTTRAVGARALTAVATPEINPPPPTGTTTWVTSSTCSQSSSPTVPWPAMTAGSSKGCTITRPRFRGLRVHAGERLGRIDGLEIDRRAVGAGRVHLRLARPTRHHHERVRAELATRERHRGRVVAGRARDDAARALVGRELRDARERTAHLERAGALEQLRLQPHALAQRGAAHDRRAPHVAVDDAGRPSHVLDRHGGAGHRRARYSRSSERATISFMISFEPA